MFWWMLSFSALDVDIYCVVFCWFIKFESEGTWLIKTNSIIFGWTRRILNLNLHFQWLHFSPIFRISRLEPPVISPVRDLSGHVLEPGAGPRVVHGDVLLGPVGQPLEVDIHIGPVTVHTRDLEVAVKIPRVQPRQGEAIAEAVHREVLRGETGAIGPTTLGNIYLKSQKWITHNTLTIMFVPMDLRSSGVHVVEDFSTWLSWNPTSEVGYLDGDVVFCFEDLEFYRRKCLFIFRFSKLACGSHSILIFRFLEMWKGLHI